MTDEVVSTDLMRRAAALDTSVLSDALDALERPGAIDVLGPIWAGARLAGRAVTVRLAPGPAPAGSAPVHLGARAIERAGPGTVIVMDNAGRSGMAAWGGLLSTAALARGVAGVVVDGLVRDADEARYLAFPVFARGATPRTARGRIHEVEVGGPVALAGIPVHPGDIVVADGSGVIVISEPDAAAVIGKAEELAARETAMEARVRAGEAPSAVLGIAYESMLSPRAEAAM
jgi:4-hydroxy-4-methyl-2-oxoglutarate aldolase